MADQETKEWITQRAAAEHIGLSIHTIRNWVKLKIVESRKQLDRFDHEFIEVNVQSLDKHYQDNKKRIDIDSERYKKGRNKN